MTANPPVTILLVEDDPGYARLVEKNLRRANVTNRLVILTSGQQAIDYLFSQGEYTAQQPPLPLFVLLDLHLPELDGYQVLQQLKADERTHAIPVVILTATDDIQVLNRCYELGCAACLTKPVAIAQFAAAIRQWQPFLSTTTPAAEA